MIVLTLVLLVHLQLIVSHACQDLGSMKQLAKSSVLLDIIDLRKISARDVMKNVSVVQVGLTYVILVLKGIIRLVMSVWIVVLMELSLLKTEFAFPVIVFASNVLQGLIVSIASIKPSFIMGIVLRNVPQDIMDLMVNVLLAQSLVSIVYLAQYIHVLHAWQATICWIRDA